MRKSILLLLSLLFFPVILFAANYYTVFAVKGDVSVVIDGKNVILKEKQILLENTIIHVGKGGYLALRSKEKHHHTITVKIPYDGTVSKLKRYKYDGIEQKSRSKEFMKYTMNRSASDFKKQGNRYMSGMGTNLRHMDDDAWAIEQEVMSFIEDSILDQ